MNGPTVRALLGVATAMAWVSACAVPPGDRIEDRLGAPCVDSEGCSPLLVDSGNGAGEEVIGECTLVDDEQVCLPAVEREPTECSDAEDCVDEGFPVDAFCEDGTCGCSNFGCFSGQVFVAARCSCKDENGTGCQLDEDCASGACSDEICRGATGDACVFDGDCASGSCDIDTCVLQ